MKKFVLFVAMAILSATMAIVTPSSASAANVGNWWFMDNGFGGDADLACSYGDPGQKAVTGDWNGDGRASTGVFVGGNWHLSDICGGPANRSFAFGIGTDLAVVGDWDGNGTSTPGVFRDGWWYLSNDFSGSLSYSFGYGDGGDRPVVGDWNGDGRTTVGVVRGSYWYLSDTLGGGANRVFAFGDAGDQVLGGDWDGNGTDTPGLARNGSWYLSNGFGGTVDRAFGYGNPGDQAIAGDWDGDGRWTPGVTRSTEAPYEDAEIREIQRESAAAIRSLETVPPSVDAAGDAAVVNWYNYQSMNNTSYRTARLGWGDAYKALRCGAAITIAVGSAYFAVTKILKIKKLIRASGGVMSTAKRVIQAFKTAGSLSTKAQAAFGDLSSGMVAAAILILDIDQVMNECS